MVAAAADMLNLAGEVAMPIDIANSCIPPAQPELHLRRTSNWLVRLLGPRASRVA